MEREWIPVCSADKFVEWATGRRVEMVRFPTTRIVERKGKSWLDPAVRIEFNFKAYDEKKHLLRTWSISETWAVRGDGEILFGKDSVYTRLKGTTDTELVVTHLRSGTI